MTEIEPSPEDKAPERRTRFGIGPRLYSAFGAITALTVLAVGLSWVAFENVRGTLDNIANHAVPVLASSFQLAAESASAAAVAPNIISAPSDEARDAARAQMATSLKQVDAATETLAAFDEATGANFRPLANGLREQLNVLDEAVKRRELARASLSTAMEQVLAAHRDFLAIIRPQVDDATFNLVLASEETTGEVTDTIDRLVQTEVAGLQAALTLSAAGQRLLGIMARSTQITDLEKLATEETLFGKAAIDMKKTIDQLPKTADGQKLADLASQLIGLGIGDWSAFAIRRGELSWVDLTPEQYEEVQSQRKSFDPRIVEVAEAFDEAVTPVVNSARIALIGGSSDLSANLEDRITTLVEKDVAQLRQMLETLAEANMAIGLMSAATSAPDTDRLSVLRSAFVSSGQTLETLVGSLEESEALVPVAEKARALVALGLGDDSIFGRRQMVLADEAEAGNALAQVQELAQRFDAMVDQQVSLAMQQADTGARSANAAVDRSEMALLALAAVSILISLGIAWLVVNRAVVRRLLRLAETMRVIAGGEHDTEVDTAGRDEITEMARAVAVFRDNAIEVERLQAEQIAAEKRASEERQVQRVQLADAFE
ncbi:HAMP domain-containing protein, partial [Thalassobaculum fulvum]|uniref:HAMP domain-containing protein n=1 Tax=Thalassobaculum fulvum TaxID=1633335 RepID=UPI001673745D